MRAASNTGGSHFVAHSHRRLYHNAERARTCNSVVTEIPGLFTSVNNSTNVTTDEIIGYISPAGIPSIASQKEQYHDVVTPYGAWPTILFDKAVGLAWWRNTVVAKKMQSTFGSHTRDLTHSLSLSVHAHSNFVYNVRSVWKYRVDTSGWKIGIGARHLG